MLFLDFPKVCYLSFLGGACRKHQDYVWFATIKDFNPSRLEFIICIMTSYIKIYSWFKLNTFLNVETTTTLNWWSSVPTVVLVVLQFPWFNFTFPFKSLLWFWHSSYNSKTKSKITNEYFEIFKVSIEWTNSGMIQTRIISLMYMFT